MNMMKDINFRSGSNSTTNSGAMAASTIIPRDSTNIGLNPTYNIKNSTIMGNGGSGVITIQNSSSLSNILNVSNNNSQNNNGNNQQTTQSTQQQNDSNNTNGSSAPTYNINTETGLD